MAEQSTHDPDIEGSNPATAHHQDKIVKEKIVLRKPAIVTQVLEHSTAVPEIEGSNPDTSRHQEKIAKEKTSFANTCCGKTGARALNS